MSETVDSSNPLKQNLECIYIGTQKQTDQMKIPLIRLWIHIEIRPSATPLFFARACSTSQSVCPEKVRTCANIALKLSTVRTANFKSLHMAFLRKFDDRFVSLPCEMVTGRKLGLGRIQCNTSSKMPWNNQMKPGDKA